MTRKEAIENIREHFNYMQEWITPKEVLKVALEALKQPEIVRCKDCKMRDKSNYCNWIGIQVMDDFFCADGVKKEDD